ncbi:MAG TPA: alpha-acetolactate decarboxylase [Lachnospiraceae bacterium]|nr:alpha-acetolactate decarboxylase [Lachnospiraceae bacterium]
MNGKMYQVSTLQALALGYTREVIKVSKLLEHGDTGLGTFTNVDGEMIVLDGKCLRAKGDGSVEECSPDMGIPFASVGKLVEDYVYEIENVESFKELGEFMTLKIDENFGLNSIHIVRIDGVFKKIYARSESGAYASHHVELKNLLADTQTSFMFENVKGSIVGVYYPDYMDGINASGWHFHFASDDRKSGGHVYELIMEKGRVVLSKFSSLEIDLPTDIRFDTYALKSVSKDDIKSVEQKKE